VNAKINLVIRTLPWSISVLILNCFSSKQKLYMWNYKMCLFGGKRASRTSSMNVDITELRNCQEFSTSSSVPEVGIFEFWTFSNSFLFNVYF